eukprot:533351-Alexandrium_andersonii.AAC.1
MKELTEFDRMYMNSDTKEVKKQVEHDKLVVELTRFIEISKKTENVEGQVNRIRKMQASQLA